jgi:hypothetical protein
MRFGTIARGLAGLALIALVVVGIWYGRRQPADAPAAQPPEQVALPASGTDAPAADPYQLSLAIYEFKRGAASGADMTVATHLPSFRLPWARVDVRDRRILAYEEKPTLPVPVASAVYALGPVALEALIPGQRCDAPELARPDRDCLVH